MAQKRSKAQDSSVSFDTIIVVRFKHRFDGTEEIWEYDDSTVHTGNVGELKL